MPGWQSSHLPSPFISSIPGSRHVSLNGRGESCPESVGRCDQKHFEGIFGWGRLCGSGHSCSRELYGYGHGNVLFKPTKAKDMQFRPEASQALSYFVGADAVTGGISEDHGFAINGGKGWSDVLFDNHQIDLNGNVAIAMGNYFFASAEDGSISKVEYTFGYKKCQDIGVPEKAQSCGFLQRFLSPILSLIPVRMARCAFVSTTRHCLIRVPHPKLSNIDELHFCYRQKCSALSVGGAGHSVALDRSYAVTKSQACGVRKGLEPLHRTVAVRWLIQARSDTVRHDSGFLGPVGICKSRAQSHAKGQHFLLMFRYKEATVGTVRACMFNFV